MIVGFRHGFFPLNERSHLIGPDAFQAAQESIPADADSTMDLLPEGYNQGRRVQPVLAGFAIYACLRSRTLRTKTTAELALAGQDLPGGTLVVPELRERSRGKFSYAPDVWASAQPDYPANKSVLDWEPAGIDYNGNPGESLRHVRETRVSPVLQAVDALGTDKIVALSGHAEWLLSLRSYYLGFEDQRFKMPLFPNAPTDNPALATSRMILNGQVEMYDCTCPEPVPLSAPERHMDVFRTVGTQPGFAFDTGWMNIKEMQQD